MFRKKLLFGLSLMIAIAGQASVKDLPVKTIDGSRYYIYEVQPSEGELAICRKLGVSREQLLKYNPSISNGLKAYQTLYFPVSAFQTNKAVSTYVAKKGDTLYGISKMFGMGQDEFISLNPAANVGVKAGVEYKVYVDAPKGNSTTTSVKAEKIVAPTVKTAKGVSRYRISDHESLYQIAHKHGCTLETLLALNPGLDANDYKVGTMINVPTVEVEASATESSEKEKPMATYTVKSGDTFYGVARAHKLTIEQLQAANPGVNVLQEGMIVNIPSVVESVAFIDSVATSENIVVAESVKNANADANRVTIAIALPFMAHEKEPERQTLQLQDFYRGFMIGVDSMRRSGKPITVMAFDTRDSAGKVDSILNDANLAKAQLIIAPEQHLAKFAKFGQEKNIPVLNLFSVRDTMQSVYSAMMQANIPHDDMVERAIAYELSMFPDYTPVVLRRVGGGDKAAYVNRLTAQLKGKGITAFEITYEEELTLEALQTLPKSGRYAFIPVVSRQADVNKFLPALIELKSQLTDARPMRLLGYPEWITFRGKTLENMKTVDTFVYSRFFASPDEDYAESIDEKFKYWYGSPMSTSLPRQALLGFDTAMFLIPTLEVNQGDFSKYSPMFDGKQNAYHFRRVENGKGWVNDEMFMINFRPSGTVDKLPL